MERHFTFGYSLEHETSPNQCAIGETALTLHTGLERRRAPRSRSSQTRSSKKFRLAMGPYLQTARAKGVTLAPESWSALLLMQPGEGTTGHHLASRSAGRRVSDRVMDLSAYRQGDLAAISRALSSACDLAAAARDGVELSETPAARSATRRGQDRALEALRVAPYKKRPPSGGSIWFPWMKAAFCLSPVSSVPGPRGDKPRSVRCATSKGRSMPSVLWPCRPRANDWRSPCTSIPATYGDGVLRGMWDFVLCRRGLTHTYSALTRVAAQSGPAKMTNDR